MNVTLRNIKYAAFASEETPCFSAAIYIDGKKAGEVSNDGHGGCDRFYPHQLQKQIDDHAATLPPREPLFVGDDGKQTAETIVGRLLDEHLEAKRMKRLCASKVLFRKPSEQYAEGEYHTLKTKFSPAAKEFLVKKYGPQVFILNEQAAA